jgi:hypothetical protein
VRLLRAAAAALERCEVASDPTGAAEEAAATLAQVVTLSGDYVPVPDLPDPTGREDGTAAALGLPRLADRSVGGRVQAIGKAAGDAEAATARPKAAADEL